jgi:hypothetical protein
MKDVNLIPLVVFSTLAFLLFVYKIAKKNSKHKAVLKKIESAQEEKAGKLFAFLQKEKSLFIAPPALVKVELLSSEMKELESRKQDLLLNGFKTENGENQSLLSDCQAIVCISNTNLSVEFSPVSVIDYESVKVLAVNRAVADLDECISQKNQEMRTLLLGNLLPGVHEHEGLLILCKEYLRTSLRLCFLAKKGGFGRVFKTQLIGVENFLSQIDKKYQTDKKTYMVFKSELNKLHYLKHGYT